MCTADSSLLQSHLSIRGAISESACLGIRLHVTVICGSVRNTFLCTFSNICGDFNVRSSKNHDNGKGHQ